ncbi:MAG TPA: hypothetical protein VM370_00260 [Candidatus Thermoplasmatota archaeon]|nr:hypothetical protein [Candidatus Thermoplasmatota archaeon]
MNLRTISLFATALCVLAALPVAPAASVTVRVPYQGPALLAYQGLADCSDPVMSVGIVCYALPNGAKALDVRVDDASSFAIGASYYLHDADGALTGYGDFCEGATLPVESGGTAVIRLEGINGPLSCIDSGTSDTAPATKGFVALRVR